MSLKFIAKGFKKLNQSLALMDARTKRNEGRKILRKAAKPIRDEARNLVPKDSGLLKKNIKIRNSRGAAVKVESKAGKGQPTNLPVMIERGTQPMRSRPYMGPALKNKEDEAKMIIEQELKKRVKL